MNLETIGKVLRSVCCVNLVVSTFDLALLNVNTAEVETNITIPGFIESVVDAVHVVDTNSGAMYVY